MIPLAKMREETDEKDSIALDFGTSEGVRKGWLKRRHGERREEKTKALRDSLGNIFDPKHPENYSKEKNVERGKKALARALRTHRNVKKAMYTAEVGYIDFDWGYGGKNNERFSQYGIAHIIDKHGDDINSLVDTIANGVCYELNRTFDRLGNKRAKRFCIIQGKYIAILDARGSEGSFCVSEYQKDEKAVQKYRKNPLAKPRVLS